MRALLPLLSVGRGWRVGAAAHPPRRVMSLYRTEEVGHPRSQDYRLFFSKSLAFLRAGPGRSRGSALCPAGSVRRGPGSARTAARGQPPSAATAAGPRRRAPPADLGAVAHRSPALGSPALGSPAPPSRALLSPFPTPHGRRTQNFGDRALHSETELASDGATLLSAQACREGGSEGGGRKCEPGTGIGLRATRQPRNLLSCKVT